MQGWANMELRGQHSKEEENREWMRSDLTSSSGNSEIWVRSGGVVDLTQSRIGAADLNTSERAERAQKGDEGIHRSSKRVRGGRSSSCHLPTIAEDQELTLERRRQKPKLELFTIEE